MQICRSRSYFFVENFLQNFGLQILVLLTKNQESESTWNFLVKIISIKLVRSNLKKNNKLRVFSFCYIENHQQRLDKLKQELDYIKTDSWKYKPIEQLIGF